MSNKIYPVANYREYRPSRNPYAQKIMDFRNEPKACTLLLDGETENYRGKWRGFFKKEPGTYLNLELGAYHGETSIHLAKTNPEVSHIGIEWKYKQCFKAGKKGRDLDLQNLCFFRANFARLPWMFAPGELDRVWILFPDPWSKASHQKWRVLHPGFLRILGCLLNEGKELMIKTDHAEYADYIKASIEEAKCFDYAPGEVADQRWQMIPPTPFERIFIRQKLPIYSFALVRNRELVTVAEEVKDILSIQ